MLGDFALGVGFPFAAVGFRMVLRVGALAGAGFNAALPVLAIAGEVPTFSAPILAFGVVIAALAASMAVIAGVLAVFLRAAELRVLDGIVLHAHQTVRRWRVVSECVWYVRCLFSVFMSVCRLSVCVYACCLWNHELKL